MRDNALPQLLKMFRSDNWREREQAVVGLTALGKTAVPALLETMADPRDDVRYDAAILLEKIGWQPNNQAQTILHAFASQQWDNLVKIGAPAIPAFKAALNDTNFYVRTSAVLALGEIGARQSLRMLEIALDDSNSYVRSAAARALGLCGEEALDILGHALLDEEKGVRQEAATALEHIGAAAVPVLIDALMQADWFLRREIIQALIRIGEPAVPSVVGLLGDKNLAQDAAHMLQMLDIDPAQYGYEDNGAKTVN